MRYLASAFWIAGGVMHFVIPRQREAIVPASLRNWRKELVVASGVAELAGGVMVLPPEGYPKIPPAALWARLPLQFMFGWLTWRGTD